MKTLELCRQKPNLCVPFILMASYLYYIKEIDPPTSDTEFDALCKLMLVEWANITHPHKKLIKKADLKAGTLYALREDHYPLMTRGAAFSWLDNVQRT